MSDGKNTMDQNMIGWFIMLIIFTILGYIFWMYFDDEVRTTIRWIRYAELWVMSWIIPDDYAVRFFGQEANWHQGFRLTPRWSAEELNRQHLSYIGALVTQPLRYVLFPLSMLAAYWCMYKGPKTGYRKKLGLDGLIERQSLVFPVIAPFIKFNPSKQPARPPGAPVPAELPLFAEALGPEEWIAYNAIPIPDGQMDAGAVSRAMTKQLIGRWRGVQALEPYQQVLMAAFCLKASRKRNEADEMLGRLALCWSGEKGLQISQDKKLLSDAKSILRNKDLAKLTLSNANKHAFVTTAMLRALTTARDEGGVLASAQFVWLRAHDRTLWYPLNNLGRRAYHPEAMGAMAHYRVEKMTDRPVPIPKMEDAVQTMMEYMASKKARPVPKLDYSGSGKRGVKKAK